MVLLDGNEVKAKDTSDLISLAPAASRQKINKE